jgi:D-3-phosphoglycerate dehydrogenase
VLVEVFDHEIEIPFSDSMMLLYNEDVPGVIGRVGTYLGDCGVNIDDMVVGRSRDPSTTAMMMGVSLNRRLTDAEIEGFGALEGVRRFWFVDLG